MTIANTTPRAMIGKIPVFCAYDEIIPIAKAEPNPMNPNQHPVKQINLLAEIIKQQGWRAPVTVSTRSGYIVRGHGRLMAAKLLGTDSIPVDYQNYESDAAEKADMVADNRIAEFSELDEEILSKLLLEMYESDLDTELAGFEFEELEKFLDLVTEDEEEVLNSTTTFTSAAIPQQFATESPLLDHELNTQTPIQHDYSFENEIQRKQGQTGEIDLNEYSEDRYTHECPKCKFKW